MLELAFPRTLTFATLTLAASLATGTAQAEPPATTAAPAVTATMAPAAPPPVYQAPLGYTNSEAPPDVEYPPEMRVRSSGMIAGGALLLSFGLVGLIAGSAMVSAHEPIDDRNDSPCFTSRECEFIEQNTPRVVLKPGLRTAGIATLVGSAVAMGAGIPLLMIGAKKVPVLDDDAARAAKLLPTLRVGAASATLTWQF
ncbi:MAG: hypothetical protein ABI134_22615 [Byssovorax sp.]